MTSRLRRDPAGTVVDIAAGLAIWIGIVTLLSVLLLALTGKVGRPQGGEGEPDEDPEREALAWFLERS